MSIYPKASAPTSDETTAAANERAERWRDRCMKARAERDALRVGLLDAIDELVECRSFIAVETRHYPTVRAINDKVEHLRALTTPADQGDNAAGGGS